MDQGYGIEVYYSNKKDVRNTVFLPDGTYAYYGTGGMLFEQISDEAIYLTTEKVLNMIRAYPGYDKPLTREGLDDGFSWLYCAIDDDELPVATAVFRSSFGEAISEVSNADGADTAYQTIGAFLEACYEEYIRHEQSFAAFFDAIAADASGTADDFQAGLAEIFKEALEELYEGYSRKCSVRHKDGNVIVETHGISNTIQLLTFEYCRLKKEGKTVKICANCDRYFIPPNRIDAIYCPAPSLQDPSRSCREVGPQARRKEKQNRDPLEREHHNARSRLNMAAKRARDNGEENLLPGYRRLLEKEKERYKYARADSDEQGGF